MPTGPVEREHELSDEALPVRALPDEHLELAHDLRVSAELELRAEPLLVRAEAELLEPLGLRAPRRGERHVGERGPAPQGERPGRVLRSPHEVGLVRRGAGRIQLVAERPCVEGRAAELQQVAAATTHDPRPVPVERLPDPRDVRLEAMRGRRRRLIAPDLVDQPLDRDDLARVQQQDGENRALLRAPEPKRTPVRPRLERAEQPEPDPIPAADGRS